MAGDTGRAVAEMSVIGCIALNAAECGPVFSMLTPEMFESEALRILYAAALELHNAETPVDATTLLAKTGAQQGELLRCTETAPHISRVADYARIVRERWRLAETCAGLREISDMADGPGVTMRDVLPQLHRLTDAQQELENAILEQSAKALAGCLDEWKERYERPPDALEIGFEMLDRYLGGFQRKGLYVLSARPGEGKSDFALNLAVRMSRRCRVNYNTLEMTRVECTERIISNLAKINSARLRQRQADVAERRDIELVVEGLKDSSLVIDEQEKINAAEVKSKILQHRPDLIILDNLQNMTAVQQRKNQWEAVADTTTMLKQIAKKYNVVILLIVQESREGGRSKKPAMDGLRGSSQIEADADGIMFLRTEATERLISGEDYLEVKLHITKNRHGGTGVCPFHWQPQYHRYISVDPRDRCGPDGFVTINESGDLPF